MRKMRIARILRRRRVMRFGIRPQAVLLAGVPLVFLLVVLGLAGLISKQTEQTSYVAEVVGQSQAMLDTVNAAKRGVRQSSGAKRPVDFGALAAARGRLEPPERPLMPRTADDIRRVFALSHPPHADRGRTCVARPEAGRSLDGGAGHHREFRRSGGLQRFRAERQNGRASSGQHRRCGDRNICACSRPSPTCSA